MSGSYPETLRIGNALFRRDRSLAAADAFAAGVGYAYDTSAGPGLRQHVRVAIVRCPACGESLRSVAKAELACTGPCGLTWYATLVNEPGRSPMLALTTAPV